MALWRSRVRSSPGPEFLGPEGFSAKQRGEIHPKALLDGFRQRFIGENSPPVHQITSRGGGTGRRAGLKIQWPQGHAGSTPALGICLNSTVAELAVPIFINRQIIYLLEIGTVPALN